MLHLEWHLHAKMVEAALDPNPTMLAASVLLMTPSALARLISEVEHLPASTDHNLLPHCDRSVRQTLLWQTGLVARGKRRWCYRAADEGEQRHLIPAIIACGAPSQYSKCKLVMGTACGGMHHMGSHMFEMQIHRALAGPAILRGRHR